ncbi:MAG TPA: metalloregulator ArsR/SmtB family transcription factor [Acidimicrobiia bacterium]
MDGSPVTSQVAVARAVADETRLAILHRLAEDRAAVAEIVAELDKPQALVSNHLRILREANLVVFEREGRKAIYRLAKPSVATLLESLATLTRDGREARATPALAWARTCYDHLAGALGVELFRRFVEAGALEVHDDDVGLGPAGPALFTRLGVDLEQAANARRRFASACLDWTEGEAHLGGSLGAAVCHTFVTRGWVVRQPATRALVVTRSGSDAMRRLGRSAGVSPGARGTRR